MITTPPSVPELIADVEKLFAAEYSSDRPPAWRVYTPAGALLLLESEHEPVARLCARLLLAHLPGRTLILESPDGKEETWPPQSTHPPPADAATTPGPELPPAA
jgi:hypothetical protein